MRKVSQRNIVARQASADRIFLSKKGVEVTGFKADTPEEVKAFTDALSELHSKVQDNLQSLSEDFPISVESKPVPKRPVTLDEAWRIFMEARSGIAETSKVAYEASYRLFREIIGGGHRMFHDISDAELLEYNDALAYVPASAEKRKIKLGSFSYLRTLRIPDQTGKMIEPERISATTKNLHRTRIISFVGESIKSGFRVGPNPLAESKRHSDGMEEDGAEPFTDSELVKIFAPENFTQLRPTVFWGILFLLHTGARVNEIACLDIENITYESGQPCISITHTSRAQRSTIHLKSNNSTKRTKNKDSVRLTPLHPTLFKLGLNDYIEDLRQIGATRLFPDLPMDRAGKRKAKLSENGNLYLAKVGVHVKRTKVLHSLRDTYEAQVDRSGMEEKRHAQFTGRAARGVRARYYGAKGTVAEFVEKVFPMLEFDCIDIEKIKYQKGKWNSEIEKSMVP
jgi:integrase